MNKLYSTLLSFLILNTAYADNGAGQGIGGMALGLFSLVSLANEALSYVLLFVGAAFCMGAVVQYIAHRQNPSQVRLTTPIFYLALGLLSLVLPFAHLVVGYDTGVKL